MVYHKLGDIPKKRHTQFRKKNGLLYTEELFGTEGFSGASSLLYHNLPPTKVHQVEQGERIPTDLWEEDLLRHHHLITKDMAAGGDPVTGRVLMLYNSDVQIHLGRPTEKMDYFYRNGEHDEMLFIHEGTGFIQSSFGRLNFNPFDYIYIPRGTTYRMEFDDGQNRMLMIESMGPIGFPGRYRSGSGQFMENSPFCERDFRLPEKPLYFDEEGEFEVRIKKQGRMHNYTFEHHPFDVVGWDGYLFPWIFSMKDFEPVTGRIHQPPPVHQTFEAPNYVICSFVPRKYDYHPLSIPAPYNHSNVDSDEVLYYVEGDFMSRKGVEYASITHHPGGIPHGPHPGTVEKSLDKEGTDEYAVMIDTFHPLNLTKAAQVMDDGIYHYSWIPHA
ncbi:MAG: homogentisate 1,2-dioxygenase [Balneolales bacterium]